MNRKNKIKMLYLNACSIKNKMDEIELLLQEEEIDVMIVTETWVKKNEKKYYNFTGFNAVYAARERTGGGLGIFIKQKYKFEIVDKIESEVSFIAIKIICIDAIFCGIYRPPLVKTEWFLNFLDEKLENFDALTDCFLVGDINIDILTNNKYTKRLLDIYHSNNFKLCNKCITTRDTTTSATLIDHFVTNATKGIELFFETSPLSDHKLQFINIYCNSVSNKMKYKIINQIKFNINMLKTDLDSLENNRLYFEDPDLFYEEILKIFDKASYQNNFKIKEKSNPWFTKELANLMKIRNKHYSKMKKYPDNYLFKTVYDHYNRLIKNKIKLVKKNTLKNSFFWEIKRQYGKI